MQIVLSQLAEAFEGSLRLSGQLSGHNTEQICFDPVGIQQRKRMSYFIPCALPSSVFWGEIFLCSPLTRRQELYIEMQLESRLLPLTFSRNKVGMLFVYGFSLSLPKPPRSIREKEYARIWIT